MTRIAHVPGFDTLSYARRLKAAGVDEAQAEAHAEAVRDAVTEGVATKDDLDRGLAAAKVDLADLETRLTVRLIGIAVGVVLANVGLTFTLLKLLP